MLVSAWVGGEGYFFYSDDILHFDTVLEETFRTEQAVGGAAVI